MAVSSLASGLGSSCGFAVESTFGTSVAPTNFLQTTSQSLSLDVEHLISEGIRAGRAVPQTTRYVVNKKGASGSVEFDAQANGIGLILRHMVGDERAYSTTKTNPTSGVYSYSFRPGTLMTSSSLTWQLGIAGRDGVVRTGNVPGSVIPEWEVSNEIDGLLTTSLTIAGRDWVPSASDITSVSYPTGTELFSFAGGAVTVGGTATEVRSVSISCSHGLDLERYQIASSTLRSQPVQNAMREITGSVEMEFGAGPGTWATDSLMDKYRAGTVVALVATWTGGTALSGTYYPSISFSIPKALITSATPTVEGPDMVMQTIEFMALEDAANNVEPMTVTYVSSENLS